MVKNPPANAGDVGSIPGSGRSPGGGHDNPLQYFRLENPVDRGAWRAAVHGVAESGMSEHVHMHVTLDFSGSVDERGRSVYFVGGEPQGPNSQMMGATVSGSLLSGGWKAVSRSRLCVEEWGPPTGETLRSGSQWPGVGWSWLEQRGARPPGLRAE